MGILDLLGGRVHGTPVVSELELNHPSGLDDHPREHGTS